MSAIDYGALLRVNGVFINKNQNLFMDASNKGYQLKKATRLYKDEEIEIDIDGNYYVYAGDADLLLCFYKGLMLIISHGKVLKSISNCPFMSETCYMKDTKIKVSRLDKKVKRIKEKRASWEEYVKENWRDASGKESLSDLDDGYKYYKQFLRESKKYHRRKGYLKYPNRWIAEWDYKGDHYEVIFGYYIDPDEEVWDKIKNKDDLFSPTEKKLIDGWFQK